MTDMTLLEKFGALLQPAPLRLGFPFLFSAERTARSKKMRGSGPRGTRLNRLITNTGSLEESPEFLAEAAWG